MSGPLGHLATIVALALAALGAAAAFAGGATRRPALVTSARNSAFAIFLLVVIAFVAMEYALITHDFSVKYVAQVGSLQTPLFYTIISEWSALEGSILLWALILATYTAIVAWRGGRQLETERLDAYALGTILTTNIFFLLLIAGPANPFETLNPAPANGPGANPLLQNNACMGVHPPLLYTGYVGMAVPFAFAVGGLLAGSLGREWSRTLRRWTLVPWGFLTLGITAGAWWSYEVLGWGGFWAWDPVENASFMPWLTATAFLHSAMVQERREMLKTWTVSLIVSTFLLTILGTFLTRSGVVASVHAFSEGVVGPFFLGYLGVVLLASVALIAWKSQHLQSTGTMDSVVSRETAFMFNNLLFIAFTFVVLLGTMFPLLAEAIRGDKVTVGGPYFNQMTVPISVALVFLAGIGPALPWRRGDAGQFSRKLLWPTAAALLVGVTLIAVGVRHFWAWLTVVGAVFAAGSVVGEFSGPAAARRLARPESWPAALWGVMTGNRRRYGGYIAHYGVFVAAIGLAISSAYKHEGEWTLSRGASQQYGAYTLQLDSVWDVPQCGARAEPGPCQPQRASVVAAVTASRNGRLLEHMTPRLNFYPSMNEPIATPAVNERMSEDLYLVLVAYEPDYSRATIKAIVSPMVGWIWVGGVMIAMGVIFGLWPRRKAGPEGSEAAPQAAPLLAGATRA